MDVEHCVIAKLKSEFAIFEQAADKRRYNVFSICPAAPPAALADLLPASASVRNDAAKLHIFSDIIAIIFEQLRQGADNDHVTPADSKPPHPEPRAKQAISKAVYPALRACLKAQLFSPRISRITCIAIIYTFRYV